MSVKRIPNKELLEKSTIPKLNSALFTVDNYNSDNSILLYEDKIIKYAVGWTYSNELPIQYNTILNKEIAIMYEVPEGELIDSGKYWQHIPIDSFMYMFIPDFYWLDFIQGGEE